MKPHATLLASMVFLLFAFSSIVPARAANPTAGGGDAGVDAADAGVDAAEDAATDADLTPEGIQPTTTPDNLNCMMHATRTRGVGAPGELVLAAGVALAMMASARRHAKRRRSS